MIDTPHSIPPLADLFIFREFKRSLECVGRIHTTPESSSFEYDSAYLADKNARPLSLSLPLQPEPFTGRETPFFFEGLLPEGNLRSAIAQAVHVDETFYAGMLAKLNDESIGGLVFNMNRAASTSTRSYKPLAFEDLVSFARHPLKGATAANAASRLSLSGAQTKIGAYHTGTDLREGWFVPEGSAPSNIIVKAASGAFPLQTVNEAFCLSVARHCGFETASAHLIPVPESEPLLAVSRFDRIMADDAPTVNGLRVPIRTHQEDFCQAAGFPSAFKYEPSDGHYLTLGARIISRTSSNPFGDKMMFFNRILFDYLMGNCDNHLKNHSMLWDADWSGQNLSPLYDVTCTTMYPSLDREMGVSLCASRRIDDVSARDIAEAAQSIGISEKLGWDQYRSLCEEFRKALPIAKQELLEQGFAEASTIAEFVEKDTASRLMLKR